MLATTLVAAVLAALVTLMVTPPQYMPSYRRGGWGKYHRAS